MGKTNRLGHLTHKSQFYNLIPGGNMQSNLPTFENASTAGLSGFGDSPYFYLLAIMLGIVAICVIVKFAVVLLQATIFGGIAAIIGFVLLTMSKSFLDGIIDLPISILIPVIWAGTGIAVLLKQMSYAPKSIYR